MFYPERCQETPDNENVETETSSPSSCQYWTFYHSLSKCFLLETCNENDDPDAESGKRDCPPGVITYQYHIINLYLLDESYEKFLRGPPLNLKQILFI